MNKKIPVFSDSVFFEILLLNGQLVALFYLFLPRYQGW